MKRRILLSGASIGALVLAGVLAYFEPWRAFTSSSIDEALPVSAPVAVSAAPPAAAGTTATPPPTEPTKAAAPKPRSPQQDRDTPAADSSATPPPATPPSAPPADRELSRGEFVDAEYDTDGTARIIELADGRRYLRLEGFSTSDGPDVHVWLSEATAGGSWGKYDDNGYIRLGKLKATNGNLNYEIPAGADLSTMRSAVIWCDRFNVAFGAAPVSVAS